MPQPIFITGGTGYIGIRIISILLNKGYEVSALVRKGSEKKLPDGCTVIIADPFNASTFTDQIPKNCIFIQLLGVSHPGPSKKELFYKIDRASVVASASATISRDVQHIVYVSVAQTPTNIMKDYQQCRAECETIILSTNIKTSILRPWYIIGPDHYWPLFFLPVYKILEWIPSTSVKAKALRLVYLNQMLDTLLLAIENPPSTTARFIEISDIRKRSLP